jgi:hypothetical protein
MYEFGIMLQATIRMTEAEVSRFSVESRGRG